MKMTFRLMLILFGFLIINLMGCKKKDGEAIIITGTNTAVKVPGTLTGTFTTSGAFNTSGTAEMVVVPNGDDSIHCTYTMTAAEGAFIMEMDCEKPPAMTGAWTINHGTGYYGGLKGAGTLVMMFPPDIPAGALSTETMTGVVWLHRK